MYVFASKHIQESTSYARILCILMVKLLQINVLTQRGFIPVDERMRVIDADGKLVRWNYPIVDMLSHGC